MIRWFRGMTILLALLPLAAGADNLDIVIVKSSDNSYFDRSIEILIDQIDRPARFKVVTTDEFDDLDSGGPAPLLVALGLPAARAIENAPPGATSFNAYLTYEQFRELESENQVGVLLDQPLYRYLAFCKILLAMDSVATIVEQPVDLDAREARVLTDLDFSFNQYRVDENNKLLPVLRRLLQQNDALLMLPRKAIFNRQSLKGVLLTSYRYRKPAISYSPAHVMAGALASIYSSPDDIGRHLAELINRKLRNPETPLPAYEFARFYTIATNTRVARALELELPGEHEIRARMELIEQ
ncbi:MAG: hypothetical protein PVI79_08905 [Gammaproteobacteria bacterium]|jgi:hypothetical protein